ncbi:hypothetical protein HHK36_003957 [Tetracentron sinense]|uniref:Uncharacterized protein n=1 Tax=Tetracentron sinense TaxID=13715 RepID=A0A835DPL2_TETSI|nr:hypothetical protein HHK36_003957 [Tetracentron sinense]
MSTATRSISSYGYCNKHLRIRHRSNPPILIPCHVPRFSTSKLGCSFSENQLLYLSSTNRRVRTGCNTKTETNASNNVQPGSPVPPKQPLSTWINCARWTLSIILSAWKNKLDQLLRIEGEVKSAIDMLGKAGEGVEEIIEAVEDKLPDGSKLKRVALVIENAAKEIIKYAQLASAFFQKIIKVEQEVEDIIDPITDEVKDMDK